MKKVRRRFYSKGYWNRLIDSLLHPLARGDKRIPVILLDGLLHSAVERNPKESTRKFIQYDLPDLIKKDRIKSPKGKKRQRKRR
jgi:hypothetical protein